MIEAFIKGVRWVVMEKWLKLRRSAPVSPKYWGLEIGALLTVLGWSLIADAASHPQSIEMDSPPAVEFTPLRLAQQDIADNHEIEANRLLQQGIEAYENSQYTEALSLLGQSLEAYRDIEDRVRAGHSLHYYPLHYIALAHINLEQYQDAIDACKQALENFKSTGDWILDRLLEGATLANLGEAYKGAGQYRNAVVSYEKALEVLQGFERWQFEIKILLSLIDALAELEQYSDMASYGERLLSIAQEIGDEEQATATLEGLGAIYEKLGQPQKSIAFYEQALTLSRKLGDRDTEARALLSLGNNYADLEQHRDALELYEQALQVNVEMRDLIGQAASLSKMGIAYRNLSQYQNAISAYDQILGISKEVEEPESRELEGVSLGGKGDIYNQLGELEIAVDFLEKAVGIFREIQDLSNLAAALGNLGTSYSNLGKYQEAIDKHEQALSISEELGDTYLEGAAFTNLGIVYRRLGDYERAFEFYRRRLNLAREISHRLGESSALGNLGIVYDKLGRYEEAIALHEQALVIDRELNNRRSEGQSLGNLGGLYSDIGEYEKAVNLFEERLLIAREIDDQIGESNGLVGLGYSYERLGQYQKATDYYQNALLIQQRLGNRAGEAATLFNRARLYRQTDNLTNALADITDAIAVIEDLRGGIRDDVLRTTYFAAVQDYYQFKIDLLMQLHQQQPEAGYDQLAFNTSERTRARSLIELLAESSIDFSEGSDNPQIATLVQQEQSLQQQRAAQEQLLTQRLNQAETNAERTAIRGEVAADLERISRELNSVVAQLRQLHPAYADLQYPEPLTLAAVQQQVLDADTVLLQYALGDKQSYLFVVTPNSFHSYPLSNREEIAVTVRRFINRIEQSRCVAAADPAGCIERNIARAENSLYEELLAPAAEHIAGKRLLIAADGILHYIPFSAIPLPNTDGYQPLLVQHEVVMTPSVTTLGTQRGIAAERTPAPNALALLADPVFTRDDERISQLQPASTLEMALRPTDTAEIDLSLDRSALERAACAPGAWKRLPYTATEAEAILALNAETPPLSALAFDATQNWLLDSPLAQYRLLHLATHGCLDAENPELSGLVLSQITPQGADHPDGFLRLHEIFTLNLNAELVVLSACQTGRGENIRGEGIVGMTRGFMFAGAEQVVVSLWNVNDQATAELMSQFYQAMLAGGETPAAALRQAQLALWNQYQDPRLWAAFTLQGDW